MSIRIPTLYVKNDVWQAAGVCFPAWAGFQDRSGAYGSLNTKAKSNGAVRLIFAPEGRGIEPLDESELQSIKWVLDHQRELADSLLAGLFIAYPRIREQFGLVCTDGDVMPEVRSIEAYKDLIGLHSVHVHQIKRDGYPYIGFEFGCVWEEEHGLGVLMHGTRVVEIGGADTAFLLWIAERDAARL